MTYAAGTMAHSYVEAFADEPAAFRAFAEDFPDRATFLVDTYDTLGGVWARIVASGGLDKDAIAALVDAGARSMPTEGPSTARPSAPRRPSPRERSNKASEHGPTDWRLGGGRAPVMLGLGATGGG